MPPPRIRSLCQLRPQKGTAVIEQAAWDLMNRCRRELGVNEIPLPVPVDLWVEHPVGLTLDITDLSTFGDEVLGVAYVAEREVAVSQTLLSNPGRFRFTIAHEIGHLTLHTGIEQLFRETPDTVLGARTKTIEREADAFAAALLMPRHLLEREIRVVARSRGERTPHQLGDADCADVWRDGILPRLCEQFEVSWMAAVVRCGSVRWTTGAPLMHRDVKEALMRRRDRGPVTDRLF